MIHRSGAWRGRAEAGSDSQLHVQLSRDSEAAGPSAEPEFQGWGAGGAGSSAASSSHWHDFLRSRARKDLKTELQPCNKFQLCLWEEAFLAWPLVPYPYTFRRREQLRWVHIPGLSSLASPCCHAVDGKTGSRKMGREQWKSLQEQMYQQCICVCVMGMHHPHTRMKNSSAAREAALWGWKCKVR